MPQRLRSWLHTKFPRLGQADRHESVSDNSVDMAINSNIQILRPSCGLRRPLPVLPKYDCQVPISSGYNTQPDSPFFSRLPAEIRHKIYMFAFGGRTVHMDLRHSGPPDRRSSFYNDTCGVGHAGIDVLADTDSQYFNKPQEWRWWSSVCHRDPSLEPWTDGCRDGRAACGGEGERKACFLGIMGWLNSCRQAYTETTPVLYSSNTLYISSSPLLYYLPLLLATPHLAAITSLELVLNLSFWQDLKSFSRITTTLHTPGVLPALRKLYLAVQAGYSLNPEFPSSPPHERQLVALLEHTDEMVKELAAQQREMKVEVVEIAVQQSVYQDLIGDDTVVETIDTVSPFGERFWRKLSGRNVGGGGGGGGGPEEVGYWIRRGMGDTSQEALLCGLYHRHQYCVKYHYDCWS